MKSEGVTFTTHILGRLRALLAEETDNVDLASFELPDTHVRRTRLGEGWWA